MRQYLELEKEVLANGDPQYNERTGQLMLVRPNGQKVFDLTAGFPITTTKSVPISWVAEELFWILRGERNAQTLYERGPNIWNKNAFDQYLKNKGLREKIPKNTPEWNKEFQEYETRMRNDPNWDLKDSDLGPVYGWQLRHLQTRKGGEIDQLTDVLARLKKEPGSRYHVINFWNVEDISQMSLAPCHCLYQFTVTRNRDLDLHMFQRSADIFLGVPFNQSAASLFTLLVANETGLKAKTFTHSFGNVHTYCGVSPRTDFLRDEKSLAEFQKWIGRANSPDEYLAIRDWYLNNAPSESPGNERKDHVPFILEQLSKEPQTAPTIEIDRMPLSELIQRPAKEVITLKNYNPLRWDSRAEMAA